MAYLVAAEWSIISSGNICQPMEILHKMCSNVFCVIVLQIMKHMVEKRRRNRINDTLEKMRILVLKAMNKNVSIFN